jgi:SET domain-containing protein
LLPPLSFSLSFDATTPLSSFGVARFVNHSRFNANLKACILKDADGSPHLCFCAKDDICEETELLIDYGDRRKGVLASFPFLNG